MLLNIGLHIVFFFILDALLTLKSLHLSGLRELRTGKLIKK